jgi:hypothetical protein
MIFKKLPNTACARPGVRTALFRLLSGFELFPAPRQSPRPPQRYSPQETDRLTREVESVDKSIDGLVYQLSHSLRFGDNIWVE